MRTTVAHLVRCASAAVAGLIFLTSGGASAHTAGLSTGEYAVDVASVQVTLTFERGDAAVLFAKADADGDGMLVAGEILKGGSAFADELAHSLMIRADGEVCTAGAAKAAVVEGDGVVVEVRYVCTHPVRQVGVVAGFVERLGEGHKHLARVTGGLPETNAVAMHKQVAFAHQVVAVKSKKEAMRDDIVLRLGMGVMFVLLGGLMWWLRRREGEKGGD